MEESYVYRQQKKLRCGYTTGTCAAAASLAAAALLLQNESTDLPVTVDTPKGIRLNLEAELTEAGKLAFDEEGIEIPYNYLNVHLTEKQKQSGQA